MFPLPHIPKPTPVQRLGRSVIANGDFQCSRNKYVGTADPVQRFDAMLSGLWRKFGHGQCLVDRGRRCPLRLTIFREEKERRIYLVHHVDESLDVIPTKGIDHCGTCARVREHQFNQGGKLVLVERAPEQALEGWSVEVKKEERTTERLMLHH